jgi:tyrosine-protein kinase Etk/Wzc
MNNMSETSQSESRIFLILYNWKKFIFINLIILGFVGGIIAFTLPHYFKSSATVMVPSSDMGLGGLTSLLGGKSSVASFGAKLFGVSGSSEDVLLGILNSRTALQNVLDRFELYEYYDGDNRNIDKIIKSFKGDLNFEPNEFGFIEISVVNKDPQKSADIANYFVRLLDSLNIEFNIEQARNNRKFIEKRYLLNVQDIRNAEDSLYKFQKKYGIVAVPEQLEVTVKAAAEIEAKLAEAELKAILIENQIGNTSPQYSIVKDEIDYLRNKVNELKNDSKVNLNSNVLFAFQQMPEISVKYIRLVRELEIQQAILEVILPLYEQVKVEEQKSMPTVINVDKAVPPQLKDSPKRLFIIFLFIFLGTFIFIPFLFVIDRYNKPSPNYNILQQRLFHISQRTKKLYKIKLY